ncbi:hypothetical protein [Acinetobacter beijerinckii]|uniref:hypothetical protein n=1 Tax=Acinetobacter beijerinckii TaxID=262668 RepID=UPI003018668B
MERFQVSFYQDDKNLTIWKKGLVSASNENEARKFAFKQFKADSSMFITVLSWTSPK